MKSTHLLFKGRILVVLAGVALAAQATPAEALEIWPPFDDPVFVGDTVSPTPSPGADPRVIHDRDYGVCERREVDLGPGDPSDLTKIPVGPDSGLVGWFLKLRLILGFSTV